MRITFCLCLLLAPMANAEEKKLKLSDEEQMILDLTNKERAKKKLPALKPNPILFLVARAHSKNMAKQQKMQHKLDGKTPAQRVDGAGYNFRSTGENIAAGDPSWKIPGVVQAWMESKGHRENILSRKYVEIGIGVGTSEKGEKYYTQVFGKKLR